MAVDSAKSLVSTLTIGDCSDVSTLYGWSSDATVSACCQYSEGWLTWV